MRGPGRDEGMEPAPVFLTAEWRWLAMLNWEIDPGVLRSRIPRGTELDSWQGRTFVSIVGFRFLDTRLAGWPVPFHRDFDEVNLRFYVRRRSLDGWRRGVVFVREIVPRWGIAAVARLVYNENYIALPMRSIPGGMPDAGMACARKSLARGGAPSPAPRRSSSPSITGAMRSNAAAAPSSTVSSTYPGS